MVDKSNKANHLIDKIEELRNSNNKNWMDLLRLSYKNAPLETAELLSKIHKLDQDIAKSVYDILKTTRDLTDNDTKKNQ